MGYLFINRKCPCKGCERRRIGCHGDCEGYRKWREEYDRTKAENMHPAAELSRSMKKHIWRKMMGR